jgi:hypothetical protein
MEIENIKTRIAELEDGKAALLKHAADLESQRDMASTFETMTNKDKGGAKKLDSILAELLAVAGKVAAFDAALRAEGKKLAQAEFAANKVMQRQIAEAAQADSREFDAQLRMVDQHLAAAADAWLSASERLRSMHMSRVITSPDDDRFRIKTIQAIKTWLLQFPFIRGGDFGFTGLAGNERCDFAKVLDGYESYAVGGRHTQAGWLLAIERQLSPYLESETEEAA